MGQFWQRQSWLSLVCEAIALFALVALLLFSTRGGGEEKVPASEKNSPEHTHSPAKTATTYAVEEEEPVETFAFDPNTADSTELLRLGLAPWQVRSIYRYRAKRGRYSTPEDFARTPGMTNEMWERLKPCVQIAEKYRHVDLPPRKSPPRKEQPEPKPEPAPAKPEPIPRPAAPDSLPPGAKERDTTAIPRREKFGELTKVDINTADTTLLMKIPGIGSVRARAIVEYRRKLGGYVCVEQAMEAYRMPDEVMEWFAVEAATPKPLQVNKLSATRMMRHPYLTFYQARAIVIHRDKHGPLSQCQDLLRMEEFTAEDIERLRPYLSFETEE